MESYERYVGQILDNRYRIEQVIGVGGMAVVFRAEDIQMKRTVAVKILKDDVARDEASVKRFINESRAVAMLSHPNIVNIYDVSVRTESKYIVMEYIEGITLKNYMQKKGALDSREIIAYTEQVLLALDHAHQKGIVHRDIKPQNIMLLKNGIIKVTDFGIAKLPNAETVTVKDSAIGTVYYISPEQASGDKIDARSDIYSLGVMMYEMAAGVLPFQGESPVSVALMQINDEAKPLKELNPQLPTGLSQIIERAMDKDPDMRYQSAAQMLRQLRRLKEDPRATFKMPKKKKKTSKYRMSHGMFPIILAITAAFLIIVVIAFIVIVNRIVFSDDDSKTITVDSFVGRSFTEELQAYFDESEIYHLNLNQIYNADIPAGQIISQEPDAGENRKIDPGVKKCEMTLTVSLGPRTMKLLDVSSLDYREASMKLRKLGLKVTTETIASNLYEVGYVIGTSPATGSVVEAGNDVTVYVSGGATGEMIKVPSFIGRTESATLAEAIDAGLRIGRVTYEESPDGEAGIVVSQSLGGGSTAYKYSVIDFVVSIGHHETETETTKETEKPKETKKTDDKDSKKVTETPAQTEEPTEAPTEPLTEEPPENGTEDAGTERVTEDINPSDVTEAPDPEED